MITDLNALLSKNDLPSILTIFGEEDFLVYEAYKKIVERITKRNEIKIQIVDSASVSDDKELVEILRNFITPELLSKGKMLVIKSIEQVFNGKSRKAKLLPSEDLFKRIILSPPVGNYLLILSFDTSLYGLSKKWKNDKQVLQNMKFPFNLLLFHHPWIEFPKLSNVQIKKWTQKRFKDYDIELEDGVLEYLLNVLNPNLWEISTEIDKIKTFLGERKYLSLQDVCKITSGNKELEIFEVTSLLARRDLANCVIFVTNFLSSSKQSILLANIILKYFKNLLILTEEIKKTKDKVALSSSIGVNPFFFADYEIGLRNYSKDEIVEAIKELINLDWFLKSTSKDEVYLFIITLVKLLRKKDMPNFD